MGLLKVRGTINIGQFWPDGQSDADTTKVLVDVDQNAFAFKENPTSPFRTTHAFKDATVIGRVRKKVIDKKNRITVRLQGIDAPELHYNATPLKKNESAQLSEEKRKHLKELNKKYRQHLGETATINLRNLLKQDNKDNIPCSVTTFVDKPNDVFDTYGRLVGDIIVNVPGSSINIGRWLVQEGWAFPTFYNSMSHKEIQLLINDTKKGKTKKRIWKHLRKKLGKFDFTLVYEKKPSSVIDNDTGPLIMPKLFRRQCTWAVRSKATVITMGFINFIKSGKDQFFLRTEFLEQGESASPLHRLEDFIKNNTIDKGPEDLIFREDPSKLVDPSGQIISDW
jgi:endonuclease YncB( thermonuclease family)